MTAAFNYARPRATAERLINRYGQTATLRRASTGGTPFDPIITTQDYACTLAVMNYSDAAIDGTRILSTDKLVYLSTAGLTVTPNETDLLIIGGEAHTIVSVKPLSPAGTVVMFELQARA
ncbi:MAG: hypothetical protein WC026_16140 [Hyphomicrobium sp.]|uniref:hypothetical protein n=1 Tax=Hyphomicrobium sp. TaxID=82 RepID=UPI00356404B7